MVSGIFASSFLGIAVPFVLSFLVLFVAGLLLLLNRRKYLNWTRERQSA
jgi:hypothetical protein